VESVNNEQLGRRLVYNGDMRPLRLSFNRLLGPIACCAFALACIEFWLTFPWFVSEPDNVDKYAPLATWLWLTAPLQGAAIGLGIGMLGNRPRWLGVILGIAIAVYIDAILLFVAFSAQHVFVTVTSSPNL
jgi:hypothetical protein